MGRSLTTVGQSSPKFGPQFSRNRLITTSGPITLPPGVNRVRFHVWSAGAGGSASSSLGYGGCGGGYAASWVTVNPGTVLYAELGAGGTGASKSVQQGARTFAGSSGGASRLRTTNATGTILLEVAGATGPTTESTGIYYTAAGTPGSFTAANSTLTPDITASGGFGSVQPPSGNRTNTNGTWASSQGWASPGTNFTYDISGRGSAQQGNAAGAFGGGGAACPFGPSGNGGLGQVGGGGAWLFNRGGHGFTSLGAGGGGMGGNGCDSGRNSVTANLITNATEPTTLQESGPGGAGLLNIPGGLPYIPYSGGQFGSPGNYYCIAENGSGDYPNGNVLLVNGSGGGGSSIQGNPSSGNVITTVGGNGGPGGGGGSAFIACSASNTTSNAIGGNGGIFGGGGAAANGAPQSTGSHNCTAGSGGFGAGGGGSWIATNGNFNNAFSGNGGAGIIFMEW